MTSFAHQPSIALRAETHVAQVQKRNEGDPEDKKDRKLSVKHQFNETQENCTRANRNVWMPELFRSIRRSVVEDCCGNSQKGPGDKENDK